MRSAIAVTLGTLVFMSATAAAQESSRPLSDASLLPMETVAAQSPAPARAFEYSDAYRTRAKIHKYASIATLPLFATEVALGQSVYSTPSGAKRSAHVAIGTAISGLFAVNTVTGVWNLWDARKDPNGRRRRLIHGILMLAADAGFAATPAVAPGYDDGRRAGSFSDARRTHRTVALTSIGVGTVGYLIMLIGNR